MPIQAVRQLYPTGPRERERGGGKVFFFSRSRGKSSMYDKKRDIGRMGKKEK
jgi:hypothetical protein